jgi:hypothetical protein
MARMYRWLHASKSQAQTMVDREVKQHDQVSLFEEK